MTAAPASGLMRLHGSVGFGSLGVPVSGGHDVDGDGHRDVMLSAMRANADTGEIFVAFGDGTIGGALDTAVADARILRIRGAAANENAGSEVWMDDLTGDGTAELIIARQNFSPDASRVGAGAVTVLIGGSALATQAATLMPIDLAFPPAGVTSATFVGAETLGRLGIWIRTGDVTGDGIADLLMGADQEDSNAESDSGAVYLVRGGGHLLTAGTVDLADLMTALPGQIARVTPPTGSTEFHFGATCAIADLDGNGSAEVIVAATIDRAGASLAASTSTAGSAHASRGAPGGRVYIAWDDNFAGVWPAGLTIDLAAAPGATSEIQGGAANIRLGEEILGGLDFDDDGNEDLFLGDIIGDATGGFRPRSGSGHVIYGVAAVRGAPAFSLDSPPGGLLTTKFFGPAVNDIASDTALQGDFDGDGRPDLAFSSPHGSPYGRSEAGIIHIIHGQSGPWPAGVDLRWGQQPDSSDVRISEVHGVKTQDVLCYSADSGDHDGDGIDDLIVNEMLGDGVSPAAANTGNLIVISGALIRDLP